MKTRLIAVFSIALMFSAFRAFGVVLPGWEHPIFESQLEEQDQDGHELGIGLDKSLTMNQQDGAKFATSFRFYEQQQVECVTAPCNPIPETSVFIVVKAEPNRCGSVDYTATELLPVTDVGAAFNRAPRTLVLHDHKLAHCIGHNNFTWDASVSESSPQGTQTRDFYGHPQAIYTVQSNPFVHNY